jgi:hypothetical protein
MTVDFHAVTLMDKKPFFVRQHVASCWHENVPGPPWPLLPMFRSCTLNKSTASARSSGDVRR